MEKQNFYKIIIVTLSLIIKMFNMYKLKIITDQLHIKISNLNLFIY